ncbi:MAG: ABC transporter permease subunit [Verrucomicrobia subdivision 3 bacterium]|nr:ABC transporter permease subunit [Limisphaerales bacterium]
MELIRQPIFLLLMTASALFIVFLSSISYFGFGDDPKLVKDSVLAVMLLTGLLASVLSASNSVTREIHAGTALAVLAKPVGRAQFLLAKFAGLAAGLAVLAYVDLIACLLASRMAFDAYGDTDWIGLGLFFGCVLIAYGLGGFSNFFLRRPFVSDAVMAFAVMATIGFVVINFISKEGKPQAFGEGIDWRMLSAAVLVLFAFWVLAGLALACSTRLEMIATLAVCSGFFLLGLMSDYLFGRRAEAGSWWAHVFYGLLPNWQLLWMADALEEGKGGIPTRYLGTACGYMVAYVGAALALALCLFEDRELT